ncbi:MAG: CBS domain-containing protein [Nitrososphaeraceae archaeon]
MSLDSTIVSGVMNPNVKTDTEEQNIMSACKIMHDNNIGSVVLVTLEDREKPVGIFTERDVVRVLGKLSPWLYRVPLRELMSRPVVTIEPTSSVKEAMQIMNNSNIRRLVVVDKDQKMVGIITLKDIFNLINRSPELITEFYGPSFPMKSAEMYEKFTEYKFDNPRPGL